MLLLLSLAVWVTALDVRGGDGCPSRAEVRERLDALATEHARPGGEPQRGLVATLARTPQGLAITLTDGDGTVLAERVLSRASSCPDLAAAAAVVIATWEVELRGRGTLGLESPPAPLPLPVTPPLAARTFTPALVATWFAGPDARAPGGRLELAMGRERAPWHALFTLAAAGPHSVALGAGEARWVRAHVGVGVQRRFGRARLWAAVDAGAQGGGLFLSGRGHPENRRDTALDVGGWLGARVGTAVGGWRPFLAVQAGLWPIERTLALDVTLERRVMPRWEVGLSVGLAWRGGVGRAQ